MLQPAGCVKFFYLLLANKARAVDGGDMEDIENNKLNQATGSRQTLGYYDGKKKALAENSHCSDSTGYVWRDLGDGIKVRVAECSKCGVAPSSVDDRGCFGDSTCPNFGKDRAIYNSK